MKKKWIKALLLTAVVSLCAVGFSACGKEKQPTEGLTYVLSSDGTYYTCTGLGSCYETDIVIASMFNGRPVTEIDDRAFYGCSGLTSVKIPYSVTSIGDYVFFNCNNLTSIEFEGNTTWYQITNKTDWENKTNGTQLSLDYEGWNAVYFKTDFYNSYWYKL